MCQRIRRTRRNRKCGNISKQYIKLAAGLLLLATLVVDYCDSLIITSVIAGNKKFKTVSFDSKFLKPLTFEKDLPSTEFRRHRTMRPPKFDIDVNIPIKLPLEDEYPREEYKKPVTSDFFFQTGEINEPNYQGGKKHGGGGTKQYSMDEQQYAAASSEEPATQQIGAKSPGEIVASSMMRDGLKNLIPTLARSIKFTPKIEYTSALQQQHSNARSDAPATINNQQHMLMAQQQMQQMHQQPQQISSMADPMTPAASYQGPSYGHPAQQDTRLQSASHGWEQQEFVPGGYVNLQLSGPTGGPKMTYEDYDKERWAQQLSQTESAMPYPILNYHQLQNFYGGLGTFTNGLAEHRYVEHNLLDKLKSGLNHFAGKFHLG